MNNNVRLCRVEQVEVVKSEDRPAINGKDCRTTVSYVLMLNFGVRLWRIVSIQPQLRRIKLALEVKIVQAKLYLYGTRLCWSLKSRSDLELVLKIRYRHRETCLDKLVD